ncbi:MAG: FliI/YscN family ATPase [Pseudomonadota bacterium]
MSGLRDHLLARLEHHDLACHYGRVRKVSPTHIEATGPAGKIGSLCRITAASATTGNDGGHSVDDGAVDAQIVAIENDHIVLVPLQNSASISPHARVTGHCAANDLCSTASAGRALDALGRPVDGQGPLASDKTDPIPIMPEALRRISSGRPLRTGICAIDLFTALAEGQRIGIFAPAGVGKTSLIGQIVRQADVDRVVICLVGERGHEAHGMWQMCQTMDVPQRYSLIVSTSDESAALRARAGHTALTLAEQWRARGEHVLLVVDSLTRMAMALREIGLAAGEPPTLRAYTPNVFAALPRFVERCGAVAGSGSISLIATVLAEDSEVDDPLSEMLKSVLDGHIVLSRTLAEQGLFPAIDISRSISRQASGILSEQARRSTAEVRRLFAVYEDSRTLVESGVYRKGSNAELDRAVALRDRLRAFLTQPREDNRPVETAVQELGALLEQAA